MGIVQVQGNNTHSSGTPNTCQFLVNNAAGNLLIVTATGNPGATPLTISDSNGNTYVSLSGTKTLSGTLNINTWYAANCAAGSNIVSCAQAAGAIYDILISEWSGVATSSPSDGFNSATGSSAAPNSGSVTTTTNGALIYGSLVNVGTAINGSGFGILNQFSGGGDEYEIQTSAGSIAATWTQPSGGWYAIINTFKDASAVSPSVSHTMPLLGVGN